MVRPREGLLENQNNLTFFVVGQAFVRRPSWGGRGPPSNLILVGGGGSHPPPEKPIIEEGESPFLPGSKILRWDRGGVLRHPPWAVEPMGYPLSRFSTCPSQTGRRHLQMARRRHAGMFTDVRSKYAIEAMSGERSPWHDRVGQQPIWAHIRLPILRRKDNLG
jgi:hypothetical protein